MKASELRAKNKEELSELVVSSKKELFNLRMQRATGELASASRFKILKKTIARAKTLLNEDQKDPLWEVARCLRPAQDFQA